MNRYTVLIPVVCMILIMVPDGRANNHEHSIKCGTPEAVEHYFSSKGKRTLRLRPDFPANVVSSQGHFRVHYDSTGFYQPDLTDSDSNGIPDWVDSTMVYLEYAWDLCINQLGYDPPYTDSGSGGGDEIDVYIIEYSFGVYGVTQPELNTDGNLSAYIFLDNNYSESQYYTHGYEALKVSTAHEFFHTIHFRYIPGFYIQTSWWMEQSSVWMEERAWKEVDDYLAYLRYFFGGEYGNQKYPRYSISTSLNYNYTNFRYGAAIWAMYLAKRFGDDQIRIIWDAIRASSYPRIDDFEGALRESTDGDMGLSDALGEFAVWNYFVKERANTVDFYPDADKFEVGVSVDFYWNYTPSAGSLNMTNLTSRYIELLFVGEWNENDVLTVTISPHDGAKFVSSVIFYNNPYDYDVRKVASEEDRIVLSGIWDKAVLVTTCTSTFSREFLFDFAVEMETTINVAEAPVYAFELHKAYPNPFNPSTTISFSLSRAENVSVSVFNSSGQKVDDLFAGYMTAGEKRIFWKPSQLAGGVYFAAVTTSRGTKTTKMLMLK